MLRLLPIWHKPVGEDDKGAFANRKNEVVPANRLSFFSLNMFTNR